MSTARLSERYKTPMSEWSKMPEAEQAKIEHDKAQILINITKKLKTMSGHYPYLQSANIRIRGEEILFGDNQPPADSIFVSPSEQKNTEKEAVWSLGCLIFEVWCQISLDDKNKEDRERMLLYRATPKNDPELKQTWATSWNANCPSTLYDLVMTKCWDKDANKRPTLDEVLTELQKWQNEVALKQKPQLETKVASTPPKPAEEKKLPKTTDRKDEIEVKSVRLSERYKTPMSEWSKMPEAEQAKIENDKAQILINITKKLKTMSGHYPYLQSANIRIRGEEILFGDNQPPADSIFASPSEQKNTEKEAVWSLGCLIFEVWCQISLDDKNKEDRERMLLYRAPPKNDPELKQTWATSWNANCPSTLYDLVMAKCWDKDANKRPTLDEVLAELQKWQNEVALKQKPQLETKVDSTPPKPAEDNKKEKAPDLKDEKTSKLVSVHKEQFDDEQPDAAPLPDRLSINPKISHVIAPPGGLAINTADLSDSDTSKLIRQRGNPVISNSNVNNAMSASAFTQEQRKQCIKNFLIKTRHMEKDEKSSTYSDGASYVASQGFIQHFLKCPADKELKLYENALKKANIQYESGMSNKEIGDFGVLPPTITIKCIAANKFDKMIEIFAATNYELTKEAKDCLTWQPKKNIRP